MGMYDTIWVKCPKCGTDIDFQSKSGDCILGNYELDNCPDDVMLDANRHSPMRCDCGAQLEIDRINRSVIVDGAQAEKIKISPHELTNNAPSEACTNTDVMESVCPNCKSTEIIEFLNRNKRQCQICEHRWQTAP